MALRSKMLAILRQNQHPSVDQAIAAALPTTEIEDFAPLAQLLLERHEPTGTIGLIHQFHRLPGTLQDQVCDQIAQFYRPMREACNHPLGQTPLNIIDMIDRAKSMRLTYLLRDQLLHGSDLLRQRAASCLLNLTSWVLLKQDGQPVCDPPTAYFLVATINKAVAIYDHHQQADLLICFVALLFYESELSEALATLDQPLGKAAWQLGNLLEDASEPLVRQSLLSTLTVAPLAQCALLGLHKALVTTQQYDDVLQPAHLLHHHHTVKALKKLKSPERYLPGTQAYRQLALHTRQSISWWVDGLHLEAKTQASYYKLLLSDPDPTTRLRALRKLMALSNDARAADLDHAQEIIALACHDTQVSIARLAIRHLVRIGWSRLDALLLELVNAKQPAISAIAAAHIAPVSFDRLWKAWPRLKRPQRIAGGKALIKMSASFHDMVAKKLNATEPSSLVQALNMIHLLNQGPFFQPTLSKLLTHDDVHVAASAVAALGTVHNPQAIEAIGQALEHPDTRVRANAVEALSQAANTPPEAPDTLDTPNMPATPEAHGDSALASPVAGHLGKLKQMAAYDESRPRANAIGAMLHLQTQQAIDSLMQMLADARPKHRLSALWLTEQVGLVKVITAVAELSITDPDEQVKQRAKQVIEQLIKQMNAPVATLDTPDTPDTPNAWDAPNTPDAPNAPDTHPSPASIQALGPRRQSA